MNLTINEATEKIKQLHNGIMQASRRTVQDAIKIGEIIESQRSLLDPDKFRPFVLSLPFSENTSNNYVRLYLNVDKLTNVENLSTAYKKLSEIETEKKQSEQERKRLLISEYRKTGIKPDGWDRSLDYEIKKQDELNEKKKQQINKEYEERQERIRERKEQDQAEDIMHDALFNAAEEIFSKKKELDDWMEKIRISDSGKDDSFQDAIIDYLETLADDNRRIEACQNIIKICRNISVELQRKQNRGALNNIC